MNIFTLRTHVTNKILVFLALASLILTALPIGAMTATAAEVDVINETFDTFDGNDFGSWTFDNVGFYGSAASSGGSANSVKFSSDADNSSATVEFDLAGKINPELSFWMKTNPSGTSTSEFVVEQYNGTWSMLKTYNFDDIVEGTETLSLNDTAEQVRFTYLKDAGNIALDDVVISASEEIIVADDVVKNERNNKTFETIQEAIDDVDTEDEDVLTLLKDITATEQITINRPITLIGGGNTISPTFSQSNTSNNSAIGVIGTTNVTISNLTINGTGGTNLHGINVYESTNVDLNDVTINNANHSAVVVNGSDVTVENISTTGSGWHAINAAPGSGVTAPTVLTVKGTSVHGEALPIPHIFTDDISKGVVVNDSSNQYEIVFQGQHPNTAQYPGTTARAYRLKVPVTPTEKDEIHVDVYANTSIGYGQKGWLFNRDASSQTEFEFTATTSSIGSGSLYVLPIDGNNSGDNDKFIGEYFTGNMLVSDLDSVSYDFQISGDGVSTDANQFYTNVHANSPGKESEYGECKFDYVPSTGTPGIFVTYTFNATDAPNRVRGAGCPATLAEMPAGSTIFFFAINLGDTTSSDDGLAGYFDNVVVETTDTITTFDFEPAPVSTETPSVPTATFTATPSNTVVANGGSTEEKNFTFNLSSAPDVSRYQLKYWNDIVGSSFKESTPWNKNDLASHSSSLGVYNDNFTQGEGTHYFAFSACNASDECSEYSTPFVVTYDVDTAPEASLTITNPTAAGQELSGEFTFTAQYVDYDDVDDQMFWAIRIGACNGVDKVGNAPASPPHSSSFNASTGEFSTTVDMSAWTNGTYCLVVNPRESAGPEFRATRVFTLSNPSSGGGNEEPEDDIVAPIVNIVAPVEGVVVSGDIEVTGTVTDDVALAHYVVTLYPGATDLSNGLPHSSAIAVSGWGQFNTSATSTTFTRNLDTALLADGEYQIRVAARDAANNRDVTNPYTGNTTSVHIVRIVVDNSIEEGGGSETVQQGGGGRVLTSNSNSGEGEVLGVSTSAPVGEVLGASTTAGTCGMYLLEYMALGNASNAWEVMKLQLFLASRGLASAASGIFDLGTESAVKQYQADNAEAILTPWVTAGLATSLAPTGNVYKTTRWHINNAVCAGSESFPVLP